MYIWFVVDLHQSNIKYCSVTGMLLKALTPFLLLQLFLSPNVRYELKHDDSLVLADVHCIFQIEKQVGIS